MNFFVYAFRARLKASVKPPLIAALIITSALILALGLIFNKNSGLTIRVGVLSNSANAPESARVIDRFIYYGGPDCEIIPYNDEEKLKQDVAARNLECGYAVKPDAIYAYRSPATVSDKVLNLIISAAFLETRAGEIGAAVLAPYSEQLGGEISAAHVQELSDYYLRNGALMEIITLTGAAGGADGTAAGIGGAKIKEPAGYRRLFHGLTGLFAMLFALLCAMGLSDDSQKAAARRVKSAGLGGGGFVLAGGAAAALVIFLFLSLTVFAGELLYPGISVGLQTELLLSLSYALALAGVSALLSVLVKADAFPALVSFIFIFSALLGGVFFDLREVARDWAFLRFFFLNYYYMDGAAQGALAFPLPQALVLIAVGGVTGAGAALAGRG